MVIVITGPTAVGKTKLSIELAKKLNGEIINADSTQIYRGMDIATAKVTKEEMENIPHHLIDIKDINEDYTVYDYQKDCRNKIEEIKIKNKTPILVGGTGLYIKAALYDYHFANNIKRGDYSNYSNEELYRMLKNVDPNTEIHINNRKRVERALDYYKATKKPMSDKEETNTLKYDAIFIGLTTSRHYLYERIDKRVDTMFDNGLLDEAKKIYNKNIKSKAVMTPIGYKELFPYFDNKRTLEECIVDMKKNSRRYAKRQYTWFNNKMNIEWFEVNFENFSKTVEDVYRYIIENS